MSAWARAVAAVAALIHTVIQWLMDRQAASAPAKLEEQRHETTQSRMEAASSGDADYLAADIDRLRQRAKNGLRERLVEAGAAESGGDGTD